MSITTPNPYLAVFDTLGIDDGILKSANGASFDKINIISHLRDHHTNIHHLFQDKCSAKHGMPYVRLHSTACQAQAIIVFLQALKQAGAKWESEIERLAPIPIAIFGHLVIFASVDPDSVVHSAIPPKLYRTLFVSWDQYNAIRSDFQERATTIAISIEAIQFAYAEPHDNDLRSLVAWAMNLPSIPPTDRPALDFALSTSQGSPADRLPADLLASLAFVQNPTYDLVPAGLLEIDPLVQDSAQRSQVSASGFLVMEITQKCVYVVSSKPDSVTLLGNVSRIFPGRVAKVYRSSEDSIRTLATRAPSTSQRLTKEHAVLNSEADDLSKALLVIDPSRYIDVDPLKLSARIPELVSYLLSDGIRAGASDIHIDIYCQRLRVRYILDGVAKPIFSWPRNLGVAFATWAKEGPCKKGKETEIPGAPKEGSFVVAYSSRAIFLRIGIVYNSGDPSDPKIDFRIQDKALGVRDLSTLSLFPDELQIILRNITAPQGIILTCGPTGSGKSTTNNACLQAISSSRNIIYTLEDPIEYRLPGITQIPVASKPTEASPDRLYIADAIRYVLRMDPDIIMVGEIRDQGTCEGAIECSNTGHLIFATVHTNSAVEVFKRLRRFGIQPEDIGLNISLIISQRLVRRVCTCHSVRPIEKEDIALFHANGLNDDEVPGHLASAHPRGCENCRGTGYKGRLIIPELLEMSVELADAIDQNASDATIRGVVRRSRGYRTLAQSALRRVSAGLTTIEEVKRIVRL